MSVGRKVCRQIVRGLIYNFAFFASFIALVISTQPTRRELWSRRDRESSFTKTMTEQCLAGQLQSFTGRHRRFVQILTWCVPDGKTAAYSSALRFPLRVTFLPGHSRYFPPYSAFSVFSLLL